MKFGSVPIDQALGTILAHSQQVAGRRLRKGKMLTLEDLESLRYAQITCVTVAQIEDSDWHEDVAAARIAEAICGQGLECGIAVTGRVNLFASASGLFVYERAQLDALNRVSEAVTVSAMPTAERVRKGQIVATVKIIPFAVSDSVIQASLCAAHDMTLPLCKLAAFRTKHIGLLQTRLAGTTEKLLEKTETVMEKRITDLGSQLAASRIVPHEPIPVGNGVRDLVDAGCDIILVCGASATTDRRDVIPSGIEKAGGTVLHFGMPVDPGNLVLSASFHGKSVLSLPGSARSPKTGGNDWLLWRLCADMPVTSDIIMGMGSGGLLKDIPARPLPRSEAAPRTRRENGDRWRIACVILAAGQSKRMGDQNKLLADVGGIPVIRHVFETASAAATGPIVLVTGYEAEAVENAVGHGGMTAVRNVSYKQGMATSIATGISALPADIDGVLIMLGDMPAIGMGTLKDLIAAFDPAGGKSICVPENTLGQGHPVLFSRRFFGELQDLHGDQGAKNLLSEYSDQVVFVPVDDTGILLDIDTPQALKTYCTQYKGSPEGGASA